VQQQQEKIVIWMIFNI